MAAIAVLHDPDALASPLRRRILEALRIPGSAASVAPQLGLTRQRVNYHLRELEKAGLVELVEERQRRGCVERVVRATASTFLLSPTMSGLTDDLDAARDRHAAEALLAASARTLTDVETLRERAAAANKRLATLTIEGEVTLGAPADLAAFGEDVAKAIARIADRYARRGGRRFRFVTGVHPVLTKTPKEAP